MNETDLSKAEHLVASEATERGAKGQRRTTFTFVGLTLLFAAGLLGMFLWVNPALGAKRLGLSLENDPGFTGVVGQINASFEKAWLEAGLAPAPAASVLTIARRLSLGLTGTLPSLEEIRLLEAKELQTGIPFEEAREKLGI